MAEIQAEILVRVPADHNYTQWAVVKRYTTTGSLRFLVGTLRHLPVEELSMHLVDSLNNHTEVTYDYELLATAIAGERHLCLHFGNTTPPECEADSNGFTLGAGGDA